MKDNNSHIIYSAADIEKYWKGQLSAADQHAMEKAALEDPFLSDAIEGYEERAGEAPAAVTADINELEKRLAERIAEKKKAVVLPFGWWKIAAMLIVVAGAGWLYISSNNSSKEGLVKNNPATESQKEKAAPIGMDSGANVTGAMADSLSGDLAINKRRKSNDEQESKSGLIQPEYKKATAAPVSSGNDAATAIKPEEQVVAANNEAIDKKDEQAPVPNLRKEANKSIAVTPSQQQRAQGYAGNDDKASGKALNGSDNYLSNTFKGNLLDQSNKPVANAFIQIPNLNIATQTDKQGFFSFRARDSVLSVSIASDGFETQNLRLHDSASLNQIILKPSPAQLNEVVVQTNGAEKRKKSAREEISIKILDAEPVIGWDKYREYLDKNRKVDESSKNIHGSVVVSFTVRSRGLSNFSIEQSLDEDLDEEAIRLIKTGPTWKLPKGKKTTATVIVKF